MRIYTLSPILYLRKLVVFGSLYDAQLFADSGDSALVVCRIGRIFKTRCLPLRNPDPALNVSSQYYNQLRYICLHSDET